jgi:hypothetical protein
MPTAIVIGVGAGLASTLLFYSAARGSPLLGMLLFVLTPLPSVIAALGWRWLSAAVAGLVGSIVMAFLAGPAFAFGHFLALGLPTVLIAHLVYLSRAQDEAPAGREWYPLGRLMAAVTTYAGALPVLILPLIGGSYQGLRVAMAQFLQLFWTQASPELGINLLTEEQIESFAGILTEALPGAFAAYWLAIFTLNLYLAGRIARASGFLHRDWPDLPSLAYPTSLALLLALAFLASFVPGWPGIAGTSFGGALLFAYLIAGLALVHSIARARAPWLTWATYTALVLTGPYAMLVLALAGFSDPLFKIKRRFGISPRHPTS